MLSGPQLHAEKVSFAGRILLKLKMCSRATDINTLGDLPFSDRSLSAV